MTVGIRTREPDTSDRLFDQSGIASGTTAAKQSSTPRGYPVHAWIREIGVENLAFEELEECAYTDRFKREKHWIAVCQTGIAAGGFNLYFGSQTCHSDETRQALRAVMTRRRADPEQQIVLKKAALNMNHVIWHVRRDKPSLDCELCTSQFTS